MTGDTGQGRAIHPPQTGAGAGDGAVPADAPLVMRQGGDGAAAGTTGGGMARLAVSLLNDLLGATPGDMDRRLRRTLDRLGNEGGFDRTFLYLRRPDRSFFNSHEWVRPGVAPVIGAMQMVGVGDFPDWAAALKAGRTVHVPDVSALPDGAPERRLLESQSVRTSLLVPMRDERRLVGVLGLDTVRQIRPLTDEELYLFASVAQAITTVLVRTRAEGALATSRAQQAAVLRAIPDLVLEITSDGILVESHAAAAPMPFADPAPLAGQPVEVALPAEIAAVLRVALTEPGGGARQEVAVGDGPDRYWIEVSGAAVRCPGSDGCRSGMAFVLRDVTPSHRQAEALGAQRRAAQAAQDRLSTALESLSDGFVLYDAQDRLVAFNGRYRELYAPVAEVIQIGATFEDMARFALARGLYPEAVGREEAFLADLMATHRQDRVQFELHLKDERILLVTEHVTPDGGRVGLRQDVTEQRKSEQRLANVIEGAQVGTWEWDSRTGRFSINERVYTMLGYPQGTFSAEIDPAIWFEFMHPDDRPAMRAAMAPVQQGLEERFEATARLRNAGGGWSWIQSRGRVMRWNADGTPRLMAGVHIDVHSLIETELRLERLIDGADVGTWEMDLRSGVNTINARWAEMLGYRLDELQPMSMARLVELLHPEDLDLMLTPTVRDPVTKRAQFDRALRFRHRDGHWVWVQSRGQVVEHDDTGRGVVFAGVHVDISGAKALEHALRAAIDRAEAANRAKSQFLANMSHEIRTPLNGVLGMAGLLAQRLDSDPASRRMIEVIRSSGHHLLDLINDILDLAKIESGRLVLEDVAFDLAEILSRIEPIHGLAAAGKDIALKVDIDPAARGWWRGDPRRLTQILHNLVGNAVKFTETGEVVLSVGVASGPPGSEQAPELGLGLPAANGPGLEIVVRDTGIGMEPSQIDKVFEEFTQIDSGSSRTHGGTGLGLPITRRLVRQMGGDIRIYTEPGKGVRVVVQLPLARAAAQGQPAAPARAPVPSIRPLRILVAEDNATNRMILTAMLRGMGHQVHVVEDGEAAVAAFAPGRFDLLLLDIAMPRRDGLSALAEIRKAAGPPGPPPAIAVTANAMSQHRDDYRAAGFDDCIAKPLSPDTLSDAIARVIAARTPE